MDWTIKSSLRYILLLQIVIVPAAAFAQQIPIYTIQELVNPGINPAYTGLEGVYDMVILSRQQWVGIEGAPRSYYLASNVPLRNRKMGVGFDIQNQSSGPYAQTGLFLNYSYTINLTEISTLSFGLRGGINSYRIKVSDLRVIDQGDYLFENDVKNLLLPNFGTGIHYTLKNYYIDFSVPLLLRNNFNTEKTDNSATQNKQDRVFNLQSGAKFKVMPGFELQPALAVWLIKGSPPLFDIRLKANIQDAFGFGMVYRISGSFSGYFTYKISENLLLGYGYELPLAYDYRISSGTHEIVIGLDFQVFNRKTLSPRRF